MDIDEAVGAFRAELRNLVRDGEVLEQLPYVTRCWFDGSSFADVSAFALDEANVTRVIQEEIAHFRNLGKEFEWKVFSFDSPPELLAHLQRAGFEAGPREALVVYDLSKGLGPFDGPFPCEVRKVEDLGQLADFKRVVESVFEKDYSFTVSQLAEAIRTGARGHDAYVAYYQDRPVSAGRLYSHPSSKFGGLYGGGTLSEFRGQGFYRAVIAARARDAFAAGARYVQVDAMPTSLPILLRLGFVHIADTWPCTLAN